MVPAYRPPAGIQGPPARRSGVQARRPASSGNLRRRQSVKRRRDVLFLLAIAVVATLAMAAATRSHTLIGVQVVCDLALAGYVALLVRLRNLASEREMTLTHISRGSARGATHDHTGEILAPVASASRRRPASRPAAYEYGGYASYGEMAMGRAAN
jgi:hypothetical protein